ncbi:MAG: cytochrome c family protein [Acidobacteriota bacterium]|nr:cytochrome c family protein [Acidobacteriota bacterium]
MFSRNASVNINIILVVLLAAPLPVVVSAWAIYSSPWRTREGMPPQQPVPFSHQHHVAGLGIDCRYCHASVEESSFAGIPPIHTCMTCHSQVWHDAPMLEPVRASYLTGVPLQWVRVYDVPQFVFFNHSVHVTNGIGCSTCHGRVDQMQIMYRAVTLNMRWCVDCHRDPARFIRPREEVLNMAWEPPADQQKRGRELLRRYHIETKHLTDCVTCHR